MGVGSVGVRRGIVVINKTTHPETFVVGDAVAKVYPVDGSSPHNGFFSYKFAIFVIGHISFLTILVHDFTTPAKGRPHCAVTFKGRIIITIRIHIGTLEKVDTDGGRLVAIGFYLARAINRETIITISQTTLHITANIVVPGVTQVGIYPLRKVGVGEFKGRAVYNFVAVKGHVVHLIVGSKGKSLGTNFHTDGRTGSFGVDVSFIIKNPPLRLVAFYHLVGQNSVLPVVGLIRVVIVGIHSRGLCSTQAVVDVVVGIVALTRVVFSIVIGIEEGSQIIALPQALVAMSRPVEDAFGNAVIRVLFGGIGAGRPGNKFIHFGACHLEQLVVFGTGFCIYRGIDARNRTSPIVDTYLTVALGGQLELPVDVYTTNPQRCRKHRSFLGVAGNKILTTVEVPPHVATRIDTGTDIIYIKKSKAPTGRTTGSTRFKLIFLCIGLFFGIAFGSCH